jgi:hypothetical protein
MIQATPTLTSPWSGGGFKSAPSLSGTLTHARTSLRGGNADAMKQI